MASQSDGLLAAAQAPRRPEAGEWFWNFLKTELSPYPGRSWVVARMTMSATIVMLVVMTFRLPGGFLGAAFTLFLSRENPTATLRAGVRVAIAFTLSTVYAVIGIMTMIDDPITHFLWILGSLFLAFYLIRIIPDYGTGVMFGFMIAGVIPLWDETSLNVNTKLENTLWSTFSVLLGATVTVAVEFVFRRFHPITALTEGIESRLDAIETVLRNFAGDVPPDDRIGKDISLYASVGTSRLRRLLIRSGYSTHFISQMNAAVDLLGRLVDIAASLWTYRLSRPVAPGAADSERCLRLASEISTLRANLARQETPKLFHLPHCGEPSDVPFLPVMEETASFIPSAFSGSGPQIDVFIPAPMDESAGQRLLAADAFSNSDHLRFALRGMLASSICYVVYMAIDWRGLATSIATCIITALTTIGSSRQKQFLRLSGAIVGGLGFGIGAQVFILPHIDSIAGFTLLFMVVTAIAAWISTASTRLSYAGVQLALAFYIVNISEFTIQTSLAIARDRVFGVLLGLLAMGLIFDRFGARDALGELEAAFAQNLRDFAELTEQPLRDDRNAAVKRHRQLQDKINAGFDAVRAQSDGLLFEFGASRQRKLQIREDLRRWQPLMRTLLQVQNTFAHYRMQKPIEEVPDEITNAESEFEKDTARAARAMADEVSGKASIPLPDIAAAAERPQSQIRSYYAGRGLPLTTGASDVITLTGTLASILGPLHSDIHETFVGR